MGNKDLEWKAYLALSQQLKGMDPVLRRKELDKQFKGVKSRRKNVLRIKRLLRAKAAKKVVEQKKPLILSKRQKPGSFYSYADRNALLKSMGYLTYADYLASKVWWVIRNRVRVRDRGRCQLCPRPATQVHHLDYAPATLAGDNDAALVSLCGHCHGKIEFDRKGKKRSLSAAQRRYVELKGMR